MVIVIIAYQPALDAGFIWDDDAYVTENATLQSLDGLGRIWIDPEATPQYYPLVHTTFWFERRLWNLDPAGYHLLNIILHALASIALWRLLRRLGIAGAWVAAAVWALHPIQVESVAWVTERKNVLSGLFFFLAAGSYLRFAGLNAPSNEKVVAAKRKTWGDRDPRGIGPAAGARRGGDEREGGRIYLATVLLFLAALLSKTVTATLPVCLLAVLWWKWGRLSWKDLRSLAPIFLLGAGLGLLTAWLERVHVGATGEVWNLSGLERILVAGRAIWFYTAKLIWPVDLSFNYQRWTVDAADLWSYRWPVAAAGTLILLWGLRRRIGRAPAAVAIIFVTTLAPALGFLNVYPFRYAYVADHFQYLAGASVVAGIVGGASFWIRRTSKSTVRTGGVLLGGAILLLLGTMTSRQSEVYGSPESLWRDTLRKNPGSWLAHNNLGTLLQRRGETTQALAHLQAAVRAAPDYVESRLNLAQVLADQGEIDPAIVEAGEAVRLAPEEARAHNTLGQVLLRAGRADEAVSAFREALRIRPDLAAARINLGPALVATGRLEEAAAELEAAVERDPESASARSNLAIVLTRLGHWGEAVAHLEEARRLDPGNRLIEENLLLARTRAAAESGTDPSPPRNSGSEPVSPR